MDLSLHAYECCTLCPRKCGVDRTQSKLGVCGEPAHPLVARSALHFWEEPPISGEAGSGTIFFSGCPLRCVYCQNHEISHEGAGLEVTTQRIAQMMLELEDQGALNINLVTALHFAPHVVEAVRLARSAGLSLPIVCNTSGYETCQMVDALADIVDVWLTDFKYVSTDLARRLSAAADYPEVAASALSRMVWHLRRRGGRKIDEDGRMVQGIIVRHLMLPGEVADSLDVVSRVFEIAGTDVDISIMSQYTPNERCRKMGGPLSGPIDGLDYDLVVCAADDIGFDHIWWQQGDTVSESFVPGFDGEGVIGPELSL